jgi:hypothetical protein
VHVMDINRAHFCLSVRLANENDLLCNTVKTVFAQSLLTRNIFIASFVYIAGSTFLGEKCQLNRKDSPVISLFYCCHRLFLMI